jgi:tripartite-type tricarboxylate transporter receptor subunit TctC
MQVERHLHEFVGGQAIGAADATAMPVSDRSMVAIASGREALLDLSQGRVHLMIDAMTSSLPRVRGNAVKALAVLSQQRSLLAPEIPSMPETNVAEVAKFEAMAWTGLLAPSRVTPEVIAYWNGQANALLREPQFVERFRSMNVEAAPPGPPERLRELMQTELARWTQLAREANIQAAPQ